MIKKHHKKFFGYEAYFEWYRKNKDSVKVLSENVKGYEITIYYIESRK